MAGRGVFNPRLVGFVLRAVRSSIRGELLTHVLTLTTVCVTLALVGGVHLVQKNLVNWAERWAEERAVAIFIDPAAEASTRRSLEELAGETAGLVDLTWQSPAATSEDLERLLGISSREALTEFAPWVLSGRRTGEADPDVLADHEAVLHIDRGTVVAEQIREVARSIRIGGSALAFFLLLGTFLVVSNTVGLALNARRDEIEIMDLVGTPLEWIYTAFLTEGVILGSLGALLATGMLMLPLWAGGAGWLEQIGMPEVAAFSAAEVGAMVALGGAIGAVGSAISLRRFLRRQ